MTTAPPVTRTITLDQLHQEARARFGPDHTRWAYQCPICGHAASGNDVIDHVNQQPVIRDGRSYLAWNRVLGQFCLACPATAASHGTTIVTLPDGREARVFELAPKEAQ